MMAFVASGAFVLGLLAATAACVYPVMIRAAGDGTLSLTAFNASSSAHSLSAGLIWWPAGALIAIGYAVLLFRMHRGKVRQSDHQGY
jgi:cytochrome d ubiquinol oxidase subunit II